MAQQKVQDLLDYVYEYCSRHMTDTEIRAALHDTRMLPSDLLHAKGMAAKAMLSKLPKIPDPETVKLLRGGTQAFKNRVAERILQEHGHEIHINRCPQCGGICRTQLAKQCRFCLHDWH